jgi:hypothetical protein
MASALLFSLTQNQVRSENINIFPAPFIVARPQCGPFMQPSKSKLVYTVP